MIDKKRRNELIDKALEMTGQLREITRPMTNEEKVLYLEALLQGIKAAQDVFKTATTLGI